MKKAAKIFVFILLSMQAAHAADAPKESAYDRILRTKTIRCGYATWPPYIMKDPNTGAISGLSHDYMEQIGRILDLKIAWTEEVGWGEYVQSLNNDRFDIMCISDWAIGERLKYSSITKPMLYSPLYAWVKNDNTRFDRNVAALNDPHVRIAVIDGDTSQNVTRLNFPNATQDALPQEAEGAQMLLEVTTGKADATIVDDNIANDFLKHNPGVLRRIGTAPVQILPEVLVFKKGERDLQDMLNNAITLIENTDFAPDLARHYKVDEYVPARSYERVPGAAK